MNREQFDQEWAKFDVEWEKQHQRIQKDIRAVRGCSFIFVLVFSGLLVILFVLLISILYKLLWVF